MYKVIILPQALNQINEIIENVIEFTGYEASGIRLFEDIYDKIAQIEFMPLAVGRLRDDGTREAFVRRYRIVYEIKENQIFILTVIHSCRIYPHP
ncbi:type II toxin-antitoxin system RelE/ParE family toxin [Histophilus somni]|uniref:Type II toxin-antitoxin system RelE/ParE family toxin n=1 Tax=Histophilus somni TaxID=731 RepID=A0AAX2S5E0_HISSO|nr:type II toxin-antitoxin system RelE/ParE family toxin [Histophilus somni]TDF43998.1 type II toxin-antitoxin system RelE/ParE family toxin [Histophilus somni]TEW30917.1 type II toxin-antitoxin system RelE/ParE family toxin [Histophilus somni]TFF03044.1 type II toxin-antitoxin system RelE/ParE family toxin [Histophilus somni]THA22465.1 type II toxin-antitoxin system RelE/ParE family toxin [Histophilus somni]THA97069.1 type II toxin-antitoxin system RelE/ParE family toxin [Histophilus somni]